MIKAKLPAAGQAHETVTSVFPTDFHSVVLPWFSDRKIVEYSDKEPPYGEATNSGKVLNIQGGRLAGIDINCPRQKIKDYQQLLCQEANLLQDRLPNGLGTLSVWLRGAPLRQFSPEALTELRFRLSQFFSFNEDICTIRGIELSPSVLDDERIALLSGLRFNRIRLFIDASFASDDRSLSKLDSVFSRLADFDHIKIEAQILFSCNSHPEFLIRLLNYLRRTTCHQLNFSLAKGAAQSLSQRQVNAGLLKTIIGEMTNQGWLIRGNHQFCPQSHLNNKPAGLQLTPWGFQQTKPHHWLALGVGAMGQMGDVYYQNDPSLDIYKETISNNRLPSKTLYAKPSSARSDPPSSYAAAYHTLQSLLCEHRVKARSTEQVAGMAALLNTAWLEDSGEYYQLTTKGVENLFAIHNSLFTHALEENYNAQSN